MLPCGPTFLDKIDVTRQKCGDQYHKVNSAGPATKTAKYHIIVTMAMLNTSCLIQLWIKMIQQMQGNLTMLRSSRHHNDLTTYTETKGKFN